jgi:hypothetical protein
MLLADLIQKLFTPERRQARAVLATYSRPYLRRERNARFSATSDFVLSDLTPFVKNIVRFIRNYTLR